MKYFLLLLWVIFIACNDPIKYPEGGYDYPVHVSNADTNYYFYPLKDMESKREAFHDSYAYLFYQPFDEPNLSIKPQSSEIFRLTYSTAFGKSVIITLSDSQIIVKKGSPIIIYSEDTSRLSNLENFHLALLKRRFPIDTSGKNPRLKHYLDSLIKLYPQLLDPIYYHKLYERTIVRNSNKFNYAITKVNLSKSQYHTIIQQINASGFWSLPYKVECKDPPLDGDSFTLEANTRKKYKIVSSGGCPDDTSKLTRACQKIIELAKMDKEINLIWSGEVSVADSVNFPELKSKK